MRAINRRLHALRRDEAGLSMTELLVSMFLSLLILTMVGSFFISVAKITTNSSQTRQSNDVAANIITEISGVVGVSPDVVFADGTTDFAVAEATATKLTVYSLSNTTATAPAPSKITFELVTAKDPTKRQVLETKCAGSISGSGYVFATGTSCSVRILGIGVLASDSPVNQLFTYYDTAVPPNLIPIGTGLNAGSRDSVGSITVSVRAQVVTTGTPPTLLTNTIVLRNLGLDSTS